MTDSDQAAKGRKGDDHRRLPGARAGHAMWYDRVADLVFVFGGSRDWTSWPYLPWGVFGGEELWAYDYESNTWS
jgi:hypothetical protein